MKVVVRKKDNAMPVVIGTEFIKLESAMKLMNIAMKPIANPPFPIERMDELNDLLDSQTKV